MDLNYIGEQLRRAAQVAGIPLERPLQTCGTAAREHCAEWRRPLETLQAALDHSNLATTSIYLRQLEWEEDPWVARASR